MHGDVNVPFGDTTITIRCTLGAAKKVNGYFGSMVEAYQRVQKMDLDAYAAIIAFAGDKEIKEVEETVYTTGLNTLHQPLSRYLNMLSNGGREWKPSESGDAAPGKSVAGPITSTS